MVKKYCRFGNAHIFKALAKIADFDIVFRILKKNFLIYLIKIALPSQLSLEHDQSLVSLIIRSQLLFSLTKFSGKILFSKIWGEKFIIIVSIFDPISKKLLNFTGFEVTLSYEMIRFSDDFQFLINPG